MIALASLIGFALVFLMVSVALSVLAGAMVRLARQPMQAAGAAVERVAATAALVLPPALAMSVTAALLGHSAFGAAWGLPDHCSQHGHHLHLCLFHGGSWAHHLWAVGTVVAAGVLVVLRAGSRVRRLWAGRRLLRTLGHVSETTAPDGVRIVPAQRDFCFSAGLLAPRIFCSRASWDRLTEDERAAVVAHERAHIGHGDLWRRAVLGLLAILGAPGVGGALLGRWERASERLCDRRAAESVGDPTVVARALLALAGRQRSGLVVGPAFVSDGDVVGRVEALLAGGSDGSAAARALGRIVILAAVIATALAMAASDPLHHGLETLLGGF